MRNVRKIVISCFQTEKKTCEIFSEGRLSLMYLDEKRQTLTFNLFNKTYNS